MSYILFLLAPLIVSSASEVFIEDGSVSELGPMHSLLHLAFYQTIHLPGAHEARNNHPIFFPLSILQLIQSVPGLKSVTLYLTSGRWRVKQWGAPAGSVSSIARPPGAEIKAVSSSKGDEGRGWRELIHSLSGLFCTSLQIAQTPDVVPWTETMDSNSSVTTMAWHPGEAVCAENLVPWISLLPCRDKAGLAQLLQNTRTFYSGLYHSMSVSVELVPNCTADGGENFCSETLKLTQTLSLVQKANRDDAPSHAQFDSNSLGSTLETLLQVPSKRPTLLDDFEYERCPVASSSKIKFSQQRFPPPPWIPSQYLTGSGTYSGRMVLDLSRPKGVVGELEGSSIVCILQVIPWPIRVWLHTLALEINDRKFPLKDRVFFKRIDLSVDRVSPLILDLCLNLSDLQDDKAPPATSARLSWSFTKTFFRVSEQPPDAHRGLDVPSAIVRFPAFDRLEVYCEGLLVQLATADISMPYNVICLTGTVLAIFSGAILNSFVKRT